MEAARQRIVAVAVILVLSVPLVVLAASSGGDPSGDGRNALRVELAATPPPNGEVVIYIKDESDNTPEGAEGRTAVRLECVDRRDEIVVSRSYPWPMQRDPSEPLGPHIHQPLPKGGLRQVVSCRLAGTQGPLEGRAKPAEL